MPRIPRTIERVFVGEETEGGGKAERGARLADAPTAAEIDAVEARVAGLAGLLNATAARRSGRSPMLTFISRYRPHMPSGVCARFRMR